MKTGADCIRALTFARSGVIESQHSSPRGVINLTFKGSFPS